MKVLIIGATGQIGQNLIKILVKDRHEVIALIRNQSQAELVTSLGARSRVADLEGTLDKAFENIEAVVFTAGSGPQTGKDKTLTVDLWGAVRCIRLCQSLKINRFVMVSALKADDPEKGSEVLKPYLIAKYAADEILKHSGLDYTILRPGRLTNTLATQKIQAAPKLSNFNGEISRENVAYCIQACLNQPETTYQVIDILDGEEAIETALGKTDRDS